MHNSCMHKKQHEAKKKEYMCVRTYAQDAHFYYIER